MNLIYIFIPAVIKASTGINYCDEKKESLYSINIEDKDNITNEIENIVKNDIKVYINNKLKEYPDYRRVNKTPQMGDYVQIGLIGYIDNETSPSISYSKCEIKIGDDILPKEIEDVILKMSPNSSTFIELNYDEYNSKIKGTSGLFYINFHSVVEPIIYNYNTVTEQYVADHFNAKSLKEFYYLIEEEALSNIDYYKKKAVKQYLLKNSKVNPSIEDVETALEEENNLIVKQKFYGAQSLYYSYILNEKKISYKDYQEQLKLEIKDNYKFNIIAQDIAKKYKIKINNNDFNAFVKQFEIENIKTPREVFDYYSSNIETGEEYLKKIYIQNEIIKLFSDFDIKPSYYELFKHDKKSISYDVLKQINGKRIYKIPAYSGFKSFMNYTALTSKSSMQYKLQQYAITTYDGFRMVNERYCIAVGTAFNAPVGQYCDLILENGTLINCVIGDIKADKDTDELHVFTKNGCCSEFIVDDDYLPNEILIRGNVSYLNPLWQSPVDKIIIEEERIDFE